MVTKHCEHFRNLLNINNHRLNFRDYTSLWANFWELKLFQTANNNKGKYSRTREHIEWNSQVSTYTTPFIKCILPYKHKYFGTKLFFGTRKR